MSRRSRSAGWEACRRQPTRRSTHREAEASPVPCVVEVAHFLAEGGLEVDDGLRHVPVEVHGLGLDAVGMVTHAAAGVRDAGGLEEPAGRPRRPATAPRPPPGTEATPGSLRRPPAPSGADPPRLRGRSPRLSSLRPPAPVRPRGTPDVSARQPFPRLHAALRGASLDKRPSTALVSGAGCSPRAGSLCVRTALILRAELVISFAQPALNGMRPHAT
jgi:hypothetical protein